MEGREERDPGYDDWFDEPEPPTDTRGDAGRALYEGDDEVWVVPEEEGPRVRARRPIVIAGRTFTTKQVAIVAACVLAVIFAALAAGGVFNGSKAVTPPVTQPAPPPKPKTSTQAQTNTTPTVQAPNQTLSPGDTGSQVTILQRALKALGYSAGKPDGDYGPSTQAAVERFQAAKGLAEDGVVGPQTLAKLQHALSG
jgi:Putative peptidoglycan binding domain